MIKKIVIFIRQLLITFNAFKILRSYFNTIIWSTLLLHGNRGIYNLGLCLSKNEKANQGAFTVLGQIGLYNYREKTACTGQGEYQ